MCGGSQQQVFVTAPNSHQSMMASILNSHPNISPTPTSQSSTANIIFSTDPSSPQHQQQEYVQVNLPEVSKVRLDWMKVDPNIRMKG